MDCKEKSCHEVLSKTIIFPPAVPVGYVTESAGTENHSC